MHLLADYIAHCSKNTDSVLKDLKDSLLVHLTIVGLSYCPLVDQGTGDMADVKGYLIILQHSFRPHQCQNRL